MEDKLDSVDSWPSSVLTYMFYEEPNVKVSRRVDAFIYGNGFSVTVAANLYKASQAAWRIVSETHTYCGICSGLSVFLVRYSMT